MMKDRLLQTGNAAVAIVIIAFVIALLTIPEKASAISPRQLQEMLDRGEEVTIIDIRSRALYTEGHILGAISIPFPIIAEKRLPPIGTVVVYGDGIRTDLTLEAVKALNTRSGIQAEILEGGFSAWEALDLTTTRKSGFQKDRLPSFSYEEFEKAAASNPDIVLVDLRSRPVKGQNKTSGTPASRSAQAPEVSDNKLTELSEAFPGLQTIRLHRKLAPSPIPAPPGEGSSIGQREVSSLLRGDQGGGEEDNSYAFKGQPTGKEWDISTLLGTGDKDTHYRRLYVLIDDGDGEAGKVAHRLKAAGITRLAILTGGEQILRRGGKPGLETIKTR